MALEDTYVPMTTEVVSPALINPPSQLWIHSPNCLLDSSIWMSNGTANSTNLKYNPHHQQQQNLGIPPVFITSVHFSNIYSIA